jgi:hypothetical protein
MEYDDIVVGEIDGARGFKSSPLQQPGRCSTRRLVMIYERGGHEMLDSENVRRIVETASEHVRELRKLSRLLAVECQLNLTRRSPRRPAESPVTASQLKP